MNDRETLENLHYALRDLVQSMKDNTEAVSILARSVASLAEQSMGEDAPETAPQYLED